MPKFRAHWLVVTLFGCGQPTQPRAASHPANAQATGPHLPPLNAVPARALRNEPPETAQVEARLTPSSCESHAASTEAAITRMRAELDVEYKRWHDTQPECWAQDREHARRLRGYGHLRGDSVGESFGYGGLGLSGVGEGGGGAGAGIGLGSIGAIGHAAGGATAKSASGTNNQVAGVDEADIVKSDGRYVYVVANGALRIVEAMSPRILSVTKLKGVVRELLVADDRAVVFTASAEGAPRCKYGYDCEVSGDGTSTSVQTFDIADRTHPKALRSINLSGSLVASRRIGTVVHTVVSDGDRAHNLYETWPEDMDACGVPEATVRAKFAALRAKNTRILREHASLPTITERGISTPLCAGLLESKYASTHTFTSLISFDIREPTAAVTTATVHSRPGVVFASESALYIASHQRRAGVGRGVWGDDTVPEFTELHKFRLGAAPSETRYVGSGAVDGHVLNQFAMDERNGHLRIATTRGKVPDPKTESAVSIFKEASSGDLIRVGAIEHLARGEDLRAIRFDDDRGYLVTFKKTDPLFSLDLADPQNPRVMGELKIPGFSTYLHRIDPTHLLSIGFDANDHGDFAYFDGVLLQLFDVSKPTEPRLLHREKIGSRGSSSEAATDHLAFNYFPEKGLLALPMSICEGGGDGRNGEALTFAGLLVYRVQVDKGFERLGGVAHAKEGTRCSTWWSQATSSVKRSIFLDDLVYSIALDRIKVQKLGAFGIDVADIALR